MAAKKSAQKKGKEFEADCLDHLRSFMGTSRCVTQRLYDSHSSGGFLPSQPGDCLTLYEGKLFLFEFKSSDKHLTLANTREPLTSLFSDDQVAAMRVWKWAGALPIVFFKANKTKTVEVWNGDYIASCYVTPHKSLSHHEDRIHYAFEASFLKDRLLDTLRNVRHEHLL